MYKFFSPLVTKYFVFFVNGIVNFLFGLFIIIIYNATDFYVLLLYPAKFISSNIFLETFRGFFPHIIWLDGLENGLPMWVE